MKRNTLTFILAGFLGAAGLTFAANAPQSAATRLPESQEIDTLLAADWKANNIKPNPPAPDDIFVRRIYLDVVGRIPTEREAQEFLGSKDANKRAKLIDKLLNSEGYVQHFFNYWADILRAQTAGQQLGGVTGVAYTKFIKDSLRANKRYDQFVREMVSAQGKAWDDGAIGYYMRDRGMPLDNMATTVRIFLGTRVECAQCHNHPFDKWSQMQFYQMAAFTYGVETNDYNAGPLKGVRDILQARETDLRKKMKAAGGTPDPAVTEQMEQMRQDGRHINEALQRGVRDPLRYTNVDYRDRKLTLPHDYKYPDAKPRAVVTASTMFGKQIECPPGADSLKAYAAWMTGSDNPRFTTVIANRLWKKVFGMGLIEPVDELMDSTVAMNPALMKHLEKLMIAKHYDMKSYLRALFNTQAYQNSVSREEVPAGVAYHFPGPILRRMTAEQMWDSFVALINPTPDMVNLTARETADKRLAGSRKLYDAVEGLAPEELLKGAEVAAGKYKEQSSRLKELQEKIAEARANDDKETVRALGKESNELQRNALKSVNDNIVVPAVLKLAAQVAGQKAEATKTPVVASADTAAAGAAGNNMSMSMMMIGGDVETNMAKIHIDGYDKPKKTDEQLNAEREAQKKVILDEAKYYGVPEKQQKNYLNYRQQQQRNWLRSAELDSPAPRGHYLREFGQSDREYVENSNSDASVPQALVLMNSQLLPQVIDPYSQLMLTINKAQYPDDKVEAAYLALLSRKPTDREKQIWLEAQNKGLSSMEDLIYALINTQQFIFIQ
jgi:hypothetical protein